MRELSLEGGTANNTHARRRSLSPGWRGSREQARGKGELMGVQRSGVTVSLLRRQYSRWKPLQINCKQAECQGNTMRVAVGVNPGVVSPSPVTPPHNALIVICRFHSHSWAHVKGLWGWLARKGRSLAAPYTLRIIRSLHLAYGWMAGIVCVQSLEPCPFCARPTRFLTIKLIGRWNLAFLQSNLTWGSDQVYVFNLM